MSRHILLVEDEPGLVLTLTDRLLAEGYQVTHSGDGKAAYERALVQSFDLILLDVMLPGKNGFDICRDLRMKGIKTPVIMLTARSELSEKVIGLKLGADDYVPKPFETLELMARIEAVLRRTASSRPQSDGSATIRFNTIEIHPAAAEITRDGFPLELSAKEFHLLMYLVRHPGEVHSREKLLHEVWGYDAVPTTRTVDVHIAWLRQKLEVNPARPSLIQTVHGIGYKCIIPD
jgi:two-component system alkaline phosphatase synthesis response regulator PhoP